MNRLTKITDSANLAVTFAYDAASKLTSKTLPNGVAATYTYDDLDRLTRLKDAKNNTVIADNNYTYNAAGQITQNIDQSGTHAYGYDAVDRLTSATYTGTPAETYTYDSVGNRTSSQRSATYSYQPVNRLTATSTASYLYDNNGNMISKTEGAATTQFAWDFENRLTQVVTPASGSVTYKYDALGRRIQSAPSSGASTNFTYDGNDVAQDKTSTNVITEYLNGPGIDNKIRLKTGNTLYYFAQDHVGSTTALTDSKGALVERQSYDAYGNSAGSTRTRYGFTGRERDSLTGLLYYRARFYDPQLGRLISEDPIGLAGGINSFAYVGNNPVLYRDPSGLCPQNSVSCNIAPPTDPQELAVAGALMGELMGEHTPIYDSDAHTTMRKGKNSNPRPIGEETSGLIIAEAYEMVSVINNRAHEKGKTWSDVVNQKDDNGEFQIRGNKDGPGYLKLIGSDVGLCTRLLYIKTAIAMVKQNGGDPRFNYWKGVLQPADKGGTFVRNRTLSWHGALWCY